MFCQRVSFRAEPEEEEGGGWSGWEPLAPAASAGGDADGAAELGGGDGAADGGSAGGGEGGAGGAEGEDADGDAEAEPLPEAGAAHPMKRGRVWPRVCGIELLLRVHTISLCSAQNT